MVRQLIIRTLERQHAARFARWMERIGIPAEWEDAAWVVFTRGAKKANPLVLTAVVLQYAEMEGFQNPRDLAYHPETWKRWRDRMATGAVWPVAEAKTLGLVIWQTPHATGEQITQLSEAVEHSGIPYSQVMSYVNDFGLDASIKLICAGIPLEYAKAL